jgi:hypothetical protein
MIPVIDYDNNGNIFCDTKSNSLFEHGSFQNKIILNKWANCNFDFDCCAGVCYESFCNKTHYQFTQNNKYYKYFWGEDAFKKINNIDYIFGCSPFVYHSFDFPSKYFTKKYEVFFLPKSDDPCKTTLRTRKKYYSKHLNTIFVLKLKNPIFISFFVDDKFYSEILPENILSKTYCFGRTGFESTWMDKVVKTLLHAKQIYLDMFSTTAVYASFLGTKINFYSSDLRFSSPSISTPFDSIFTVDKKRRGKEYIEVFDYLENIFTLDNDDDKKYLTKKLLSLNRIKKPENLFYDLKVLHERKTKNKVECKYLPYNHKYDKLYDICKMFDTNPSGKTLEYYELI